MKKNIVLPFLFLCLLCPEFTACSVLRPYQPDVQQGNLYTPEMEARIKPGMSKEQVLAILGNPILGNLFNDNHWAYVYTLQRGGKDIYMKRLDIYFQGGRVVRVAYNPPMAPK